MFSCTTYLELDEWGTKLKNNVREGEREREGGIVVYFNTL
jgi:hypothetical protein